MTHRAALKTARNQPQQSRSRATVGVILDAAIRVLDREGLECLTTSRVAEVAGVSVGTLYQYFGHRDDIIDALQDREFERSGQMLQRVLENESNASDEAVAHAIIAELFKLYRAAPALHRVLAVDGLRYSTPERVLAFDVRSVAQVKGFLSFAGPRIRQTNLDAAAFVIYQSIRATMLAYLLESPAGVPEELMVSELTQLILRYLSD